MGAQLILSARQFGQSPHPTLLNGNAAVAQPPPLIATGGDASTLLYAASAGPAYPADFHAAQYAPLGTSPLLDFSSGSPVLDASGGALYGS